MVESVVSGGFREAIRAPLLLGAGWLEAAFRFHGDHGRFGSSRGRVSRSRALEGGERLVTLEWKPWPQRNTTAAPS